ncbi:MAG: hypothetical protein DHS20C05_12690 [Hyphococcus sp.]|nr:MAG: hypothetical protein DHS20C05_12690 [Marinicaulis sp.]
MMGNGLANIVAALIVALAIIWTGGFGDRRSGPQEEDFDAWYARAVGDIRNDIVVNCGCCGEEEGQRRAASKAF